MTIKINLDRFNLPKKVDFKILERCFHQHLSSVCNSSGASKSQNIFKIDIEIETETKKKVKLIWDLSELKKRFIKIELINEENKELQLKKVNEIVNHVVNLVKNPSAHLKSCYLFGYAGNLLDGSYKLPKIYITPGHINTNDSLYSKYHEKVIYLYLEIKSTGLMEAKETSRFKLKNIQAYYLFFWELDFIIKAHIGKKTLLQNINYFPKKKNINGSKILMMNINFYS